MEKLRQAVRSKIRCANFTIDENCWVSLLLMYLPMATETFRLPNNYVTKITIFCNHFDYCSAIWQTDCPKSHCGGSSVIHYN